MLKIETGSDNPILRKKSVKISKFDKKLKKFAKEMIEAMLKKDGLGLAAPQVGVNERLVILNFQLDLPAGRQGMKNYKPVVLVNPGIVDASVEVIETEEGCLSLPGIFGKVKRYETVTVKFQDEDGNKRVLDLDGLNSRAIQHEIDHIDGILFVDKVARKIRKEKSKI